MNQNSSVSQVLEGTRKNAHTSSFICIMSVMDKQVEFLLQKMTLDVKSPADVCWEFGSFSKKNSLQFERKPSPLSDDVYFYLK